MLRALAPLRALSRNRLVQFLAMGALIAVFAPRATDEHVIVIEAARVQDAFQSESVRRGRTLSAEERTKAVQDLIDDEVLAREAIRLDLGTSDAVVRARLAERMRTSLRAVLPSPKVSDATIGAAIAREIARAPEHVRVALWFLGKEHPAS